MAQKLAMSLAHGAEIVKRPEVTHDAFLGGKLTITQPAKGFRAGLDSVLLGAAVGHGDFLRRKQNGPLRLQAGR